MGKRSKIEEKTIMYEAGNVPRYDIDGNRYGSTLTDDMIYLKNPRLKLGIDRHAPTSLPYFTRSDYLDDFAQDNTEPYPNPVNPTVSQGATVNSQGILSRKKNIDYSADGGAYTQGEAGLYDGTNMEDVMGQYHKYLLERKAQNDNSIREDVRYIRSNGITKHSPGEQWLRDEAEYDPYVDTVVNYNMVSPAQLEQLVNMGVNRPESEDLMNKIHLYKYYMDNLR